MKKVVVARGKSNTMSDTSSIVWFPIFKPPAFGKITQILHMPQHFCVIEQKWCHDWLYVAFVSISGQRYVNCLQDKSVFIKMSNIKEQNCICSLFQMNPCFDVVFFSRWSWHCGIPQARKTMTGWGLSLTPIQMSSWCASPLTAQTV